MRMDEIITQSDTFIGEVHQSFSVLSCRTDQSFIISIYRETRPHKACHRRDSCLTRSIERVIVTLHTGHWTCCQRLPRFSLSLLFSAVSSRYLVSNSRCERGGGVKKKILVLSIREKKKEKVETVKDPCRFDFLTRPRSDSINSQDFFSSQSV